MSNMLLDEMLANPTSGHSAYSAARGYNGAAYAVQPPPVSEGALVTFANDAAATYYTDDINTRGRGARVILYISAITGAGHTVTLTIQGKDPVSGTYYDMLVSAGIVATGSTRYSVYPGLTAVANVTLNDILPPVWRVKHVHSGTCTTLAGSLSAISLF